MNKKSYIKKYLSILFLACMTTQELCAYSFREEIMKILSSTAVFSEIGYAAYMQIYRFFSEPVPHADTTQKKIIIFDIDGVVSTTNKMQAFYEVGTTVTLNYIKDQKQFPSEKVLFDTLATIPAISTQASYNKGLRIPQIMVDWQTGAQNLPSIRHSMSDYLTISTLPQTQKAWAFQTALMMTDPQKFVATRQTIPMNIALLKELKDQGYTLYILSNWDATSFPLFQAKFPEIFIYNDKPMFDGIMISGQEHMLKPMPEIFERCICSFGINPKEAIFIDDEPANINGARNAGITSVLANPSNPEAVRNDVINVIKKHPAHDTKNIDL